MQYQRSIVSFEKYITRRETWERFTAPASRSRISPTSLSPTSLLFFLLIRFPGVPPMVRGLSVLIFNVPAVLRVDRRWFEVHCKVNNKCNVIQEPVFWQLTRQQEVMFQDRHHFQNVQQNLLESSVNFWLICRLFLWLFLNRKQSNNII